MMMNNRSSIIKIMRENPVMLQNMWSDLMNIAKNDSTLMNMMQNRNVGDMKMKGMHMKNNQFIK